MTTTKNIAVASVRAVVAFALSLSTAAPVAASDWTGSAAANAQPPVVRAFNEAGIEPGPNPVFFG